MALRCNNCGAPLAAPDLEQPYVACSYCQTVTELPRRRPSRRAKAEPRPVPAQRGEAGAVRSSSGAGTGAKLLVAVALLAAAAGAIPALKLLQDQRPLPAAVPASGDGSAQGAVARVAVVSTESTSVTIESKSERTRAGTAGAPGAKKALRGTGGSGAAPAPSPSPSAKALPAATESAQAPPPAPKNLRVSISGAVIEAGDKAYSIKDVTAGLQKGKPAVTACYTAVLAEKPDTAGTLDMGLQIAPQGTTRGVGVRGSFLPSNFISCVNRAFLAVRFPPTAGESVNIRYKVTVSAQR